MYTTVLILIYILNSRFLCFSNIKQFNSPVSSQLIFQLSLFLNIFIFQQQEESDGDGAEETVPVQQEDNSLGPVEVDDAPTPPKRSKDSSTLMALLGPAYTPKEATVPQKTQTEKAQEEVNKYR